MTEIDRELRSKVLNAGSLATPHGQSLDSKIMPKAMQSRSPPPSRWIHPQTSCGTDEPLDQAAVVDMAAAFGNKESIRTLAVSQSSSELCVIFELSRSRWMKWNNARFAEFALPDLKARRLVIQLNIGILQANRLTNADAGARHQPKEHLISMWSQRSLRPELRSRFEQIGSLLGGV